MSLPSAESIHVCERSPAYSVTKAAASELGAVERAAGDLARRRELMAGCVTGGSRGGVVAHTGAG